MFHIADALAATSDWAVGFAALRCSHQGGFSLSLPPALFVVVVVVVVAFPPSRSPLCLRTLLVFEIKTHHKQPQLE